MLIEGGISDQGEPPAARECDGGVRCPGSRFVEVPRGRPSPKLAITVDPDVYQQVVAAADEAGVSVSAWMTRAARTALRARAGLQAVAEWEAEHGPLTEEELAAARRRVMTGSRRPVG